MSLDRLTFLDDSFLVLDSARAPLHVSFGILLEGDPPSLSGVRRHLDGRMHRVPRFRRRVVRTALAGGERRWVDDPAFDVANHVSAITAPAPGDEAALRHLAASLLAQPLPGDRPLWHTYVVTGLLDGWAFIGQAHHALVDGAAAIDVAALLFDAEPNPPTEEHEPWTPGTGGTAHEAVRMAFRRSPFKSQTGRSTVPIASRPGASASVPGFTRAVDAVSSALHPRPISPFIGSVTPRRAIGWARLDLAAASAVARASNATVNDVLLTCSARALGRAMERRNLVPTTLAAIVPVNVRDADARENANAISALRVDIPADEPDLRRALEQIAGQTHTAKNEGHADLIKRITNAADALPGGPRGVLTRLVAPRIHYDVAISDVVGPNVRLYFMGRAVRALFPGVPTMEGHALTIGGLSYCGTIYVGVSADAEMVPDAQLIAEDVTDAMTELVSRPARG